MPGRLSRKTQPKEQDETSESDGSEISPSEGDSSEGKEPRKVENDTNHLKKKNNKSTIKKVGKGKQKQQDTTSAPKGGKKNVAKVEDIVSAQKPVKRNITVFEFLFCIGVVIIALLYFIESDDALTDFCDPYKSNNCSDFLKQQMENLSKKHGNQDKRLFHVLRAAAMSHVLYNPKPLRPIVIMVYNCHARPILEEAIYGDISKVYEAVLSPNRRRGTLEINCKDFVGKESDVVQESILMAFENGYEKEGNRVAVVHHFDLLPSCSVLTFHNLCNNDDAPYKDMAIILTVTGEKKHADENDSKALEQIISQKFQEKWKDCPEYLPADKIDAMLSRIANNVVVLK